jgi:hypothetical protein
LGVWRVSRTPNVLVCRMGHVPTETFIEPVLIHVPVDIEVSSCRERELGFWVLIGSIEGVVAGGKNTGHSSAALGVDCSQPVPCSWPAGYTGCLSPRITNPQDSMGLVSSPCTGN